MAQWDALVDGALASLAARRLLFNTRLIALAPPPPPSETSFAGPGPWDRATVEIQVDRTSIQQWLAANGEVSSQEDDEVNRELILFSGNDYMCLSSHPAVREAAVKAAQDYGMGPRGSSLICGYTTYHKLVEESLAELQKKEDCLLCPTGFSANTALMTALGSISSLLVAGSKPAEDERIAIFSDALNHASTIDGIRLVERQHQAVAFVYKHCDMSHLDFLLSSCSMEKKVVVTDSLFSMDGDFAPLPQLVKLRNKYGFLLVVDDAHGTLLCGENGGGIPELFGCEDDIDICVGSLSKGVGCQGGFIACSTRWKRLILSRGRSFIFSTALPVPVVASVHAAIHVSKKERWRRSVIWEHVQYFASLTKLNVTSPIIVILVGSEEAAVKAHRHLLRSGFLVQPIRPPVVPPNSSRFQIALLRITLSSAHTSDDIRRLVDALAPWLPAQHAEQGCASVSRL
ncbi:8-amino-7-oxononanoate synthase-like isoform X1 [Triticum dicoccoides]|uniref:8-amino-7-oxononanoate synthase-like isoform X1 n=1 Tax=Triticum dicoccoides TaxID=85692 RepID=UPI00188EFAB2|nr:8-amino-7-oxononanoate synthase-like isoform X1 [Triticum dicoccoides]